MKKFITVICILLLFSFLASAQAENVTDKNQINLNEDLLDAAGLGELELAKALLERGAEINYQDTEGWTALHWAARAERVGIVKYLISKGADVNLQGRYDMYTPLHLVCKTNYRMMKNRLAMAEALLDAGADVRLMDESGTTALHMAVSYGHKKLAIMLIEHGAKINFETEYHKLTPLHEAASAGNTELVKILIAMSADVNADGRNGWTPLHGAKDAATAKLLVEAGADVNAVSKKGLTPLSEAVARGEKELAEYLIKNGADINHKLTKTERSLLHYAGNPEVARLLIDAGLDPKDRDRWGYTPLHTAVIWEKLDTVKFFVEKGLDINAKIRWFIRNDDIPIGSTPLDIALDNGPDNEIVNYLKELGAKTGRYLPGDLYYEDLGDTEIELFRGVRNGQLTVIKNRLNKGADVNAVDNAGWTPLHWAAYFGRPYTCTYLIRRGANVNALSAERIDRRYHGRQTPLDVAEAAGHDEVAEKLKELGGVSGKNMPSEEDAEKLYKGIKDVLSSGETEKK